MTIATAVPAYQQFIVAMEGEGAPNWTMEDFHRAITDLDACVVQADDGDWRGRARQARNILMATAEHRWRDYPRITAYLQRV
jgi:hypothetical protein